MLLPWLGWQATVIGRLGIDLEVIWSLRNVCELSVILAVMLPAERDRQFRVISVSCQRGNSRPSQEAPLRPESSCDVTIELDTSPAVPRPRRERRRGKFI